jgi:hypothetical protein
VRCRGRLRMITSSLVARPADTPDGSR